MDDLLCYETLDDDLHCYETLDDVKRNDDNDLHDDCPNREPDGDPDDDLHRITEDVLNQLMTEYLNSILLDQTQFTRALNALDGYETGVSSTSESTVLSSKMSPTMRCLWQS